MKALAGAFRAPRDPFFPFAADFLSCRFCVTITTISNKNTVKGGPAGPFRGPEGLLLPEIKHDFNKITRLIGAAKTRK